MYSSSFELFGETVHICSTDKGVYSLSHDKVEGSVTGEQADLQNTRYIADIKAYAEGSLSSFDWSFHLDGTPFQQDVWQALLTIPYGETVTYGDIARQIGRPKAVRAVGGAIGRNPVLIAVPCHRVIGKNGRLTGFSSGLHLKRRLLDVEHIPYFD
ncbi:methylated-DNA--[protein]-cysteine S-methyltransferase [Macrococcus hajekii]|uniref:methylated-DNA--[protein]-cysteine S-methyltransferase n=1 Tax=Macrococcus hajekii TaxID=198482 RepID=A0A4V3BE83_9STAP|nr:methylated-DNA--[protein]-cysteine S-methyltransferase [Macrococcus hajekii]TDM01584.1 methylated-DNA--[protein]-cysteine S-methyltransferase [Macrococcus hajekii]GGB01225.1 hypothetical protein GCM10007190_06620 [Macrococcus hajekii]